MKRAFVLLLSTVFAIAFVSVLGFETRAATSLDLTPQDPGLRGGAAGAGGALGALTPAEQEFFDAGLTEFADTDAVGDGLGPRANLDGCGGCHGQPAIGGTSPAVNPQVAFASQDGGADTVPSFLTLNGPIQEARFIRKPDGTRDGGVHALFTITGRSAATGCVLAQPDFDTELANANISFRIPTPVFGAGLIEQIPDSAILANQAADAAAKSALGIRGRPNHAANDGTIARFGWKAQNKSLLLFAGEAYNVEMGITNELFPTERDETPECQFLPVPNTVFTAANGVMPVAGLNNIEKFALFMRFLAAPTPSPDTPGGAGSIATGRGLFSAVGCALCHTPSFTTATTTVAALSNQSVNLFSDLLLHDMGAGLADSIDQGQAGPRAFRSAPLWGLGQRIFFLHDGRTTDLLIAIQAHQSPGSEANRVIQAFNALGGVQQQDLLNFLRSL